MANGTTGIEHLTASLSGKIDDTLQSLIPRRSACALLDFPNYANVGDSAIWLGERAGLRRAGARVVYTSDVGSYSKDQLAARLHQGIIVLQGGGNLGDLWPVHQHFREEVIAAFPDHKILQMPQTIYFKEKANLIRARAVFDKHPDLTLLVRDRRSLEFARNEFKALSLLCPDMTFALGALKRPMSPSMKILWLSRTDIESSGASLELQSPEVERVDWIVDDLTRLNTAVQRGVGWITHHQPVLRSTGRYVIHLYDLLARRRLTRGCRILARGHVVITDRLHGHILSLLLKIPHVLLDNNYGKVRSFYKTWTEGCELTDWADSPEEALERAKFAA